MEVQPADLGNERIGELLRDHWSIDTATMDFAPVGFGSYHWRITDLDGRQFFATADDLDNKAPWGASRAEVLRTLTAAFDAVLAIQAEGNDFVVAPLPTTAGDALTSAMDRWTLVLHPLVEGTPGVFAGGFDHPQRAELLRALAALHTTTARAPLRTVPILVERSMLEDAMSALDRPWSGGPYSEPAREWLIQAESDVRAQMQRVAAAERNLGSDVVITHGEPHPGNTLWTASGLRIVDWDTVALATRERDLWFVKCDDMTEFEEYEALTQSKVDAKAIEAYRRAWDLSDIALYVDTFRRRHEDSADTAKMWQGLRNYLDVRSEGD